MDALTKVAKAVTGAARGTSTERTGRGGRRRRTGTSRRAEETAPRKPTASRSTERSTDGPRLEYSPQLDGDPDPGEVVWAWVAYEDDPSQGKDRPVVIIGRRGAALLGLALTSREREGAGADEQVFVGTGAWDREGRPSWAKLDRILDIEPSSVRREGAILDRERFDRLVDALRDAHGS